MCVLARDRVNLSAIKQNSQDMSQSISYSKELVLEQGCTIKTLPKKCPLSLFYNKIIN